MRILLALLLLTVSVHGQRFVKTFPNLATMAAANPNDVHTQCIVEGYASPQDGGGGAWMWIEGDGTPADGGTVLVSTNPNARPGRWKRNYSGKLNVRWFGAVGDGTDQTTQINAAYAAIDKTQGGTLYFPVGDYLYNLVILDRNITLEYETSIKDAVISRSRPANNALPLVQIGDGSANCRGYRIIGGFFEGPLVAGSVGLSLRGGAIGGEVHSLGLANFHTNFFALGGATLPVSTCRIYGGEWQSGSLDNGRCLYIATPTTGTSYTTDISFFGTHINGSDLGTNNFCVELDAAYVNLITLSLDVFGSRGILFSRSAGSNPSLIDPYINLSWTSLDLNGGGTIAKTFDTDRNWTKRLRGTFNSASSVELSDGTVLSSDMAQSSILAGSLLHNTYMYGALRFVEPAVMTALSGERNMLIYRSGTTFNIENTKAGAKTVISALEGIDLSPNNGQINVSGSITATDADDASFYGQRSGGVLLAVTPGLTEGFIQTKTGHDLALGANNNTYATIHTNGLIDFDNITFKGSSPSTLGTKNGLVLTTTQPFSAVSASDATIRSTRTGGASVMVEGGGAGGYVKTSTAHSLYLGANNTDYILVSTSGNVVIGNVTPDPSAALTVASTTRGFLPPKMTTGERDAIGSPVDGLVLYNTTTSKLQVRAGGAWVDLH